MHKAYKDLLARLVMMVLMVKMELTDIMAQRLCPTGHGINPVPVTENQRIPDISEIVDAQLYLGRYERLAAGAPR